MPRLDQHRQHERRRELAGLGLRSGDGDLLHAGEQLAVTAASFGERRVRVHPRRASQRAEPRASRGGKRSRTTAAFGTNQPGGSAAAQAPPEDAARTWTRRSAGARQPQRRSVAAADAAAWAQGLDGLPIVKPPYGVIAAIDLNTRHAEVPGAARRYAGQRPQPPAAARASTSRRPARAAASASWSPRRWSSRAIRS